MYVGCNACSKLLLNKACATPEQFIPSVHHPGYIDKLHLRPGQDDKLHPTQGL